MTESNKKMMMWVVGIVVVVLIVGGVWAINMHNNKQTTANDTSTTPADATAGTDQTPVATGQTASNIAYNDALKIYGTAGNNYRFQFSANCQGTPAKLSIKKGQKFMLDNRDTVAHTFAIGGQSVRLGKYGFAVLTASQLGTLDVRCDGATRVTLNVEP